MPTHQEISAKVDELQTALDTEQQEVADFLAAQDATIAELQALVAEGGTTEERQAIVDKLTAATEDLKTTIPNLPPPTEGRAKGGKK